MHLFEQIYILFFKIFYQKVPKGLLVTFLKEILTWFFMNMYTMHSLTIPAILVRFKLHQAEM
jgi:hypothetical protein